MLEVHIDGACMAAEPSPIVRMILDGRVDRSTPARDLTQSKADGPLERFLQQTHFEELGGQLLQRLQSMYVAGSYGIRPSELRDRVQDLRKWDWPDPVLRGRLLWLAGWLEELTGSFEEAVRCYETFLQQHPSAEAHLRLLTYNNLGALRIRLRRAEGITDLARAAILMDPDQPESQQPVELPAACFNLLNLVNKGVETIRGEMLRDEIEVVLVDFMAGLPKDVRERWIGRDPKAKEDGEDKKGLADEPASEVQVDESARDGQLPPGETAGVPAEAVKTPEDDDEDKADLRKRLSILRDPKFERLNKLTSKLAARAVQIAAAPKREGEDYREFVSRQLHVWSPRPQADVAGSAGERDPHWQAARTQHADYAEAASLLHAHDIPPSLTPQEYTIDWAERLAQESFTRAEEYLAAGDYDLARSTLGSVLAALNGVKESQSIKALREQFKRQMQLVARRQTAHEQLGVHQACTDIRKEVDGFCTLTELCHAQRESEGLQQRLRELRVDRQRIWGEGAGCQMEDLPRRVTKHLHELERRDLEAKVKEPLRRLNDERPHDWTKPVPVAAYEALAECRINDPDGRVDNWDRLKSRLDSHQARYHFQRVLKDVSGGKVDRKQSEATLALALTLDPSLGPAAAPIFGLLGLPPAMQVPDDLAKIRAELLETATRLLTTQPLGEDGCWSPAVRANLVKEACSVLQRIFRAFVGLRSELVELWDGLSRSFTTLLVEGRPEIIEEIEQLIQACLDACPTVDAGQAGRVDPRNPLNLLREVCKRARPLGRGEELLNAEMPQPEEAAKCFIEAMELGLERRDQLRRAAIGVYLARIGIKDPPELQRRILNDLDVWVLDQIPESQCSKIRCGNVADKVKAIKQQPGPSQESRPEQQDSTGHDGHVEQEEPARQKDSTREDESAGRRDFGRQEDFAEDSAKAKEAGPGDEETGGDEPTNGPNHDEHRTE